MSLNIKTDNENSLVALTKALKDLDALCESVESSYKQSVTSGNYE